MFSSAVPPVFIPWLFAPERPRPCAAPVPCEADYQDMPTEHLLVGNLPYWTKEGNLEKFFEQTVGPVAAVELRHNEYGYFNGQASVYFHHLQDARRVAGTEMLFDHHPLWSRLVVNGIPVDPHIWFVTVVGLSPSVGIPEFMDMIYPVNNISSVQFHSNEEGEFCTSLFFSSLEQATHVAHSLHGRSCRGQDLRVTCISWTNRN